MSKVRIEEVPSGKIPMLQEALTTLTGFYDSKDSGDFESSRNKEKPAVSTEFEINNCEFFAILLNVLSIFQSTSCLLKNLSQTSL